MCRKKYRTHLPGAAIVMLSLKLVIRKTPEKIIAKLTRGMVTNLRPAIMMMDTGRNAVRE